MAKRRTGADVAALRGRVATLLMSRTEGEYSIHHERQGSRHTFLLSHLPPSGTEMATIQRTMASGLTVGEALQWLSGFEESLWIGR